MVKQAKKPTEEKRPYHRGNVAEDLIAAAVRLLKTERYEDLSVRRLTREVGVTPANFYNHFENLEDLLLTIAAERHLTRAALVAKIVARSPTRIDAAREAQLLDAVEPKEVRFFSRTKDTGETKVEAAPIDSPDWKKIFTEYNDSLGGVWLAGGLGGVP